MPVELRADVEPHFGPLMGVPEEEQNPVLEYFVGSLAVKLGKEGAIERVIELRQNYRNHTVAAWMACTLEGIQVIESY